LRSINNLQERFHQSFFFYLLPSTRHYVSIGMYMPAFGLLLLPIIIKILTIWFSIFFKDNSHIKLDSANFKNDSLFMTIFVLIISNLTVAVIFGLFFNLAPSFSIHLGSKHFNLTPKDSLFNFFYALSSNCFLLPFLYKKFVYVFFFRI
jgi:hypothetical protein